MKDIKNKKVLFLIIIFLVLLGAFIVYKLAFSDNKNSRIVEISVSDLEEKINSNETFILVISQTGCSHCEQYLPELERTLKEYDLTAYDLNITGLSEEDSNKLAKYVNFSGTPTTIFFTDGEEKTSLNRIVGYASKSKIVERFKSLGFID